HPRLRDAPRPNVEGPSNGPHATVRVPVRPPRPHPPPRGHDRDWCGMVLTGSKDSGYGDLPRPVRARRRKRPVITTLVWRPARRGGTIPSAMPPHERQLAQLKDLHTIDVMLRLAESGLARMDPVHQDDATYKAVLMITRRSLHHAFRTFAHLRTLGSAQEH